MGCKADANPKAKTLSSLRGRGDKQNQQERLSRTEALHQTEEEQETPRQLYFNFISILTRMRQPCFVFLLFACLSYDEGASLTSHTPLVTDVTLEVLPLAWQPSIVGRWRELYVNTSESV